MEYADGGDLSKKISILPIPEDKVLLYFIQITLAIKQIHDSRMIHWDLNHKNMFIAKIISSN